MAARMTTNHSGTIHCGIIEQRSLGTADSNRGDDSQILDREPNKQPSRLRASEGCRPGLVNADLDARVGKRSERLLDLDKVVDSHLSTRRVGRFGHVARRKEMS